MHLKIMPGAEKDQVEQAMLLADRLSLNLEAPHSKALSILAPKKTFLQDLIQPLLWINEIRSTKSPHHSWKNSWPSSTTQFVVGAADESDLDILTTTDKLYHKGGLSRTYFSSFNPIENTPLENTPPSPPLREHRLYQASFLLRDYGFTTQDLVYEKDGNLPQNKDPKQAWADQYLLHNPPEINTASKQDLLRIPGIGPTRADSIVKLRKHERIRSFNMLKKRNLVSRKSAPYILIDGRSPSTQMRLF
jgi:predicted DNA-binding helix-hairpin-helix protein